MQAAAAAAAKARLQLNDIEHVVYKEESYDTSGSLNDDEIPVITDDFEISDEVFLHSEVGSDHFMTLNRTHVWKDGAGSS